MRLDPRGSGPARARMGPLHAFDTDGVSNGAGSRRNDCLIASGVLLSGCSADRPFGPTIGDVFGGGNATREAAANAQTGIGVNAFLWRATLDTLSFMPLANADPWGGVVNYDWYSDPQTPNERFKATVFILDTRLRADA